MPARASIDSRHVDGGHDASVPGIFRLPVQRIRDGYYSDAYFVLTKQLLEDEGDHPRVTMQVFQKQDSVLGGIDEAIAVLKTVRGHVRPGRRVGLRLGRAEGQRAPRGRPDLPRETVMTIEGDYSLFAHLETVYLGSLARRSLIMHNVREVVEAARGKEIFYFPARHDHWLVQTGDGWAPTSRARSASPRTRRRRGGAAAGSAPSRTA